MRHRTANGHANGLSNGHTHANGAMPNGSSQSQAKGSTSGTGATAERDPLLPLTPREKHPRLLSYEESLRLVPWQTDNEFVRSGYRPQLRNLRACVWSAIGYVHNETVNIHTHVWGAVFFAALFPLHVFRDHFPTLGVFPANAPATTAIDKLCLGTYFVCACTCLGLSSWFHTVQCHSEQVCFLAHCGDYVGIAVLIVGSILPGLYYGFYGQPVLQAIYMAGILSAGLASGHVVLSPHHRAHRWHRTLTFIGLGLSAVVPVMHVVLSRGLPFARHYMGFDEVVLGGASYIFGALLYAARIPESLRPGKFDYVGSSHQIFHCFVLLGAWFQFTALRGMVLGRALAPN